MIQVQRGDEVVVELQPGKVLEIAVVKSVGPVLIELTDGRMYFASDGRSIRDPQRAYVVAATDQHRAAFKTKRQ